MDILSGIVVGAREILSIGALLALAVGTLAGIIVGTLPGLGPAAGIGLLIPLAYMLSPLEALLFYISLYQAAEYSGSITAISISLPGAPNSAAVIADGYSMNRNGQPGLAYAYSLWTVVAVSYVTIFAVIAIAVPVSNVALTLGASGYVMLGVFGLATVGSLSGRSPGRGLLACAFGILLSTVGVDPITAQERFTFRLVPLVDGIALVPFLVGLFAVPQIVKLLFENAPVLVPVAGKARNTRVWLSWPQFRGQIPMMFLGGALGFLLGIVPGLAGVVASFISYNVARLVSKNGKNFGTGVPDGIVAPEATNAAVMHSTLIPAFLLGIPGTPTSAIIVGAMVIMGLEPGPNFIKQQSGLFYGIFVGLLVSTTLLWLMGAVATRLWARVALVDHKLLGIVVLLLCVAGAYSSGGGTFDVGLMLIFGLIALLMNAWGFSVPALVMGFIVGPIVESNLRRMLILSDGSFLPLVVRPVCAVLLAASILIIALGVRSPRHTETMMPVVPPSTEP